MRRNKGLFTGMMLFGAGIAVLSLLLGTGWRTPWAAC